jgi:hypothetical protein
VDGDLVSGQGLKPFEFGPHGECKTIIFLDEFNRADGYTMETCFYLAVGKKMPLRRRLAWRLRRLFRHVRTFFSRIWAALQRLED